MRNLIAATIFISVTTVACGPSDEELLATALAATRSAESIISTAIAATEEAAPTSTPTIRPTFTPQPSETPSLTELQLELLSGITVLEDDLPSSFTEISPEELNFSEREVRSLMGEADVSVGNIFSFFDDENFQVLIGFTIFLPDRLERASFDADLRQEDSMIDAFASELAGAEIIDRSILLGIDDIGDSSAGFSVSFIGEDALAPVRMDVIALRRGVLGAFIFELYVDGESPGAPIADLARTLDTKIQIALE